MLPNNKFSIWKSDNRKERKKALSISNMQRNIFKPIFSLLELSLAIELQKA